MTTVDAGVLDTILTRLIGVMVNAQTASANSSDEMMERIVKQLQDARVGGGGGDGGNRLTADKTYKRLEKFNGGEAAWAEWKADFLMITGTAIPEMGTVLREVALIKEPVATNELAAKRPELKLDVRSKELYEVLFMLTSGEAKLAIKSEENDGLRAWQILNHTYSRMTLAKTLRHFRAATNPPQAGTLAEVISKVSEWEGKV